MSAYSKHTNLAVRKRCVHRTQEAGCMQSQQTTHEANDDGRQASIVKGSAHRLRTFQYFAESCHGDKGAFETRHSFLYFVGTHFRIFVRKFLVHLRTVYASLQKLARPLVRASHLRPSSFY